MRGRLTILAALSGLVLAAGCSTPESRIARHPEAFASLPPDQQALVRDGRVGIGMDEETVKLALGNPSRISTITKADGTTEIWHYEENVYYDGAFLYPGPYPYWGGPRGYPNAYWAFGPGPLDYLDEFDYPIASYDRFRIGFTKGKVSSIRQENR
jgi:hypothetical protein